MYTGFYNYVILILGEKLYALNIFIPICVIFRSLHSTICFSNIITICKIPFVTNYVQIYVYETKICITILNQNFFLLYTSIPSRLRTRRYLKKFKKNPNFFQNII